MDFETLLVTREDPVATVTFNRPDRLNTLSDRFVTELYEALGKLGEDRTVRAIILTGTGRAFCAGGDVKEMDNTESIGAAALERGVRLADQLILRLAQMEKPTIAAINGLAVGGGCALTLACDIRIASTEARFGVVFIRRGLTGADMGATWFLQRIVGLGPATEMLLTGDIIDAQAAKEIRLVNQVVPPEALMSIAREKAAKLAAGPPVALKMTKRAIAMASTTDLVSALEYEDVVQTLSFFTEGAKEGIRSFIEKRRAVFEDE